MMARGYETCVTCFKLAEDMDETEKRVLKIDNNLLKECVSSLFGAGFGTVAVTLRYGILIMALHPEIQQKVQNEIDRVIGRD